MSFVKDYKISLISESKDAKSGKLVSALSSIVQGQVVGLANS